MADTHYRRHTRKTAPQYWKMNNMKTNDKKYQYTKGELIETGQPDFRSLNAQSGTLGIVSVANIYGYLGDNNARRILECWNACVGMDHPITEIDKLKGDLSVARERVEAKTKIVYYAHCIALYDTPQEIRDLNTLTSMGFDVIDASMEWLSGLSGCCYNLSEVEEHGMLNGYNLFNDYHSASKFKNFANRDASEHAPFSIWQIWGLESEFRD